MGPQTLFYLLIVKALKLNRLGFRVAEAKEAFDRLADVSKELDHVARNGSEWKVKLCVFFLFCFILQSTKHLTTDPCSQRTTTVYNSIGACTTIITLKA